MDETTGERAGGAADVVLVGGGLANSLIALRLKALRPSLRVVMLERSAQRDAAHTWSFFQTDLTPDALAWALPLTIARWPGYEVHFPNRARRLSTPYAAISADKLGRAVEAALGADLVRSADAREVSPRRVVLADGRSVEAPLVIDGRGARASGHMALAWQKFFGLEVRLSAPHGLERPMVMDATVPQLDGFRFVYVLPLAADVLLIEDTRYSKGPALDADALSAEIMAYAAARGWRVAQVLRQEQGVLPIVLGGDIEGFWKEQADGVPKSGMRAALFHPTTGYSLPDAVSLAEAIARAPDLTSAALAELTRSRSIRLWRERALFRALNRMMFLAAEPEDRYRVLQRFYGLSQPLIERFYAGRLRWGDRVRLLAGAPPVPIGRALRALPPSGVSRELGAHA